MMGMRRLVYNWEHAYGSLGRPVQLEYAWSVRWNMRLTSGLHGDGEVGAGPNGCSVSFVDDSIPAGVPVGRDTH